MVLRRIGLIICDADIEIIRATFPQIEVRKTYQDLGNRLLRQVRGMVEWVQEVPSTESVIGWNTHYRSSIEPMLSGSGIRYFTLDLPYGSGIYFRKQTPSFRNSDKEFGIRDVAWNEPGAKELDDLVIQLIEKEYLSDQHTYPAEITSDSNNPLSSDTTAFQ